METVTEFLTKLASSGIKLSVEAGRLNAYAQKGTLTSGIKAGILARKADLIALLENQAQRRQPKPREFPLSTGQKGLYLLQKLHPEMSAYNCPVCLRISGEIDVPLLEKAWQYVLEQYPILTATVIEKEGGLFQRLADRGRAAIQQHVCDIADEEQLLALVRQESKKPFDLNRGPLARIDLFSRDAQTAILLITVHHLVYDGASAMILLRSFLMFYQQLCEGKPVVLAELPGYEEFVAWEEAMLASPEGESHASYWQQQLSGELPILELLPDLPRLARPSFEGTTLVEKLPEDLSRWVHEFTRAHSLSPSVLFFALFQLVLHKYSNQDEVIVGMPVTVRPAQRSAPDVGYFINMVPLRTRCGEHVPLKQFLRKVQGTMLDALYHSSYPFPLMVEKLASRQARKDPVFQVAYGYQNFIAQSAFSGLPQWETFRVEPIPEVAQEGDFDLSLEIFDYTAFFSVHLKYNPDIYGEQTMRRLLDHYCELLTSVRKCPDLSVHEYSMLAERERSRLLTEFNDTGRQYREGVCLHQLFAERVAERPDATAVAFDGRELSYRQLHDASYDLALYLQARGVGPDRIVPLLMDRSLGMMAAIMGTVLAGGAYLPLDPDYPDERLAYVLQDSKAAVVLADAKFQERLAPLLPPNTELIAFDRQSAAIKEHADAAKAAGIELRREVQPHHLAYVIYTSGSTGQPKGVMVEHRNAVNLVEWHRDAFALCEGDRSTCLAGLGFDAAAWEIWPCLTVGATLVLPTPEIQHDPEALLQWWAALPVDVSFLPTPLAEFALSRGITNSTIRILLTGGDRLHRLPSGSERFRLINNYGPTECTVVATSGELRHSDPILHIGRPIANAQVYILDDELQPVPIGVAGEIYIGGAGVARGYLNQPELTAERFLRDPFSSETGARMYKSGDMARWLEDGTIQYLGRTDTQVKVRGLRIELADIEVHLGRHPQVQDCAVIAQGEGTNKQLIAFYRARGSDADHLVEVPVEELRAHLLRTLPDSMVPAAFVSMAAIPLSPNGKVDRRALARHEVTIAAGQEYVAPRNDTETRLVGIWADVLNRAPESIGINDNFFELGGHSLLATQLAWRIRSQLGADVPLKTLFERGSIAQIAGFIANAGKSEIPPIQPVDRTQFERLPLSFAQERMWFLNELDPQSAAYNVPGAVSISGALDIAQLEKAFNFIIARHENLRTIFPSEEGQARQRILNHVELKLERIDLSDREARDDEARRLCETDAAAPFDLANGPLLRGKVIKLAEHEHILMINMHHVISDGWSHGVLLKELGMIVEAYRQGREPELAPLPIQYVDYSVWQRRWLEEGGILARQLRYWQEKLAGVPESLDLATDYPRPTVQSLAGANHTFALDAQLTTRLKRIAEQEGGTLFMVLLAAFKVLLHRYTGQNDICVGTPIANRQYGETEALIGMFVNTLALRSQVDGNDSFMTLLSQVKATCLEAYEHQDAPFEKVVDLVSPQRNLATSALFQVMLVLQNTERVATGESIRPYPLDSGTSKFDLTVDLMDTEDGLVGSIRYSTALYKSQTIARLAGHFTTLCQAIATTPTAEIRALDYLGDAEKHRLLVDYNSTHTEYSKDRCLPELFAEQVARYPEKTAVVCGEERLTYRELDVRSNQLAHHLRAKGVGPETLVGLRMERSLELIVGILGILKAGGAYVPFDPANPPERTSYMLQDSGVRIVVTEETMTQLASTSAEPLSPNAIPENAAYVIYTSGSTGRPKGCVVTHANVARLMQQTEAWYGFDENDVWTLFHSVAFDFSVWEMWGALLYGGRIVVVPYTVSRSPEEFHDLLARERVTVLNQTPSAFKQLMAADERRGTPLALRHVIFGGEALQIDSLAPWFERHGDETPRLVNMYGITETTVHVTYRVITKADLKRGTGSRIGVAIPDLQLYVLDQHQQLVPEGVAGELYVGGAGVARGYLGRPELTAQRMISNPFGKGRLYRTGDLVRWRDDGLEYLGRIDDQVKIRGFRVELGEIETRLMEHEGVREAVVVAREDTAGEKRLVAYYTPSPERAFPVAQFLRLRKTDAGAAASHCTLPNGMTVFHQNQSETDFVYDDIFQDNGYLKHGITLNDGDCVFDVGAKIGLFCLFVAQRCRNATIYAFEPIPPVFTTLQLNSRLHGWNGKFYECGLAETSRQQVFKEYTCQLRTISEILQENDVDRIDLLKIDVAKGERDVLRGIRDDDWPRIRQLVIEVDDVSGRLAEVVGLLETRGYEVHYEQSQSLQSTSLYDVYALRASSGRISTNGNGAGGHVWSSPEVLLRDIRAFLREHLPEYMVPAVYVPLDEMPLTRNGKLDREALPAPEAGSVAVRAYEPPRGEIEQTLVLIWQELLHVERVGRNDNFFELGGHSLLATQLISKIRSRLDVAVPLKAVFERGSLAQLAQLIAGAEKNDIPRIVPADRSQLDRLPLSFAQERLWFLSELEPNSAGYNIPGAVIISGALDISQLEEAFNRIIARHENLRTVFPSEEGQAHQRVLDRVDFKLERIDLSHYPSNDARDKEARRQCQADAAAPFDLASGPLIRGKVIKLAEDEHILMLNMHHIISDGWSHGVLIRELAAIMSAWQDGRHPELPPLPIQYADYSVWQRRWLKESGVLERQLTYWQKKLAGVPESLDLPTDYRRPNIQSFAGATHPLSLDAELAAQLKGLAEREGATLYMVLLAAFKVLLHRYTGQNDICLGTPIANRQYGETEGLIGMFVNTLAMRSHVDGDDPFIALLSKVKTTCLEAYEHQDAPFERVVDAVRPQRNLAISPLFQVMFILQNVDMGEADPHVQPYRLDSGISKFDLTFEFIEIEDGLAGSIEYCTALYEPATIARMADHFVALCRAITSAPDARVRDLQYFGDAERQRLLVDYNATQTDYPNSQCIHQLLAAQVALHADEPAVVCGREQLTYQQLYERSRDLALYLQSQGVRPESLVGVCMRRSLEMVVGLLGILEAGGAYVPLDPDYPDERLEYMVRDSRAGIVLTQEMLRDKLATFVAADTRLIALDTQWPEIGERVDALKSANVALRPQVAPHHLAYVIYTSGSTGRPKGVMVEHRNVVNHASYFANRLQLSSTDRVLQFASLSFDTAVEEIFPTWLSGACLVLRADGPPPVPSDFLDIMESSGVTVLDLPTAYWHELAEHVADSDGRTLPSPARAVVIGGEAASTERFEKWRRVAGDKLLLNTYGPTETTIIATAYEPVEGDVSCVTLPIGRPIANVCTYVLDAQKQPVPMGVAGELYIGGAGVTRGYFGRPELTEERFIANPFRAEPGERLYRTGDRVRYRCDGVLEFLGRVDDQVKIRGFRIEPGEIEAALTKHPAVRDAVVLAREDQPGHRRLVAYVVTYGGETLPAGELRAALKASLPEFMIPAAFVPLDAIPKLPNGKLDRRTLARMDVTIESGQAYVAPRNGTEKRLVEIWAQVLNLAPEKIGIHDDFFELGGHSLAAVPLMVKTARQFDKVLPLSSLFTAPNIAAMAELISSDKASSFDILVPIQPNGDAPPIFAVPGAGGNVLSLRPLGQNLGDHQPLFAFQAVGLDGKTPPHGSVEQTAQANIAAMKTVQPSGPYRFVGHSYGGVVAYEMARILLEQGEEISSLTLVDSLAPSLMRGHRLQDEIAALVEACQRVADADGAKLEIDLEKLRQLTFEERVRYLTGLLRDQGLAISSEQFAVSYRVYWTNLLCYHAYTPSSLPRTIDVSLYRATQRGSDRQSLPRDYGWDELLQSPINTSDVDADHFSILTRVPIRQAGETVHASVANGN